MLKASFHNIQAIVIENIQNSKGEIKIAMAWFTNQDIFGELVEGINRGIKCTLLISDDSINKRLNLKSIVDKGGELKIIQTEGNRFLHEKFAIFDSKTLITGSYNYTYNAEYNNFESIIITDDNLLIQQYQIRFKKIYDSANVYEQTRLVSKLSEGITQSENLLGKREQDLKDELIQALSECKKLHVDLNYPAIFDLIEKYGAIGTPKRLIATGIHNIQSGFVKLALHERLDLTFEYIISKEKYKSLFDERTISEAQKRLASKK